MKKFYATMLVLCASLLCNVADAAANTRST